MDEIENKENRFKASYPFWIIAGVFIFTIIFSSLSDYFVSSLFGDKYSSFVVGVSEYLFLLCPVLLIGRHVPMEFKELFRLNFKLAFSDFYPAIIGLIGFQVFASGFMVIEKHLVPFQFQWLYDYLNNQIDQMYLKLLGGHGTYDFIRATIVGASIPALVEELVFRGFLQRLIKINTTAIRAIIYSGLIFGIMHFNLIGLVPIVILGFFLGYLADSTKSIFPGMLVHFLNNFIAVISIYAKIEILENPAKNISFIIALLLTVGGLIIVFFSLLLIRRFAKKNNLRLFR